MRNIAIILAGGSGSRFKGSNKPKQFLKLAGKTILEHTIEIFNNHNSIDEIAVVINNKYKDFAEEIISKNNFLKVKRILNSGTERHFSSLSAINAYNEIFKNQDCNIIFHDAVRPMLNPSIITNTITALKNYNAVNTAIKATDTIVEIKEDNTISNIPNRNILRNGQTPQAFKLSTISKAYALAMQDKNFTTTDDCGVVKKYLPEEKIYVVEGSLSNIKITHLEDLAYANSLFQIKTEDSFSNIDLSYLKGKVVVVFGGSYGIGKDIINIAKAHNAKTYSFSRSENNTDITNVESVKNALQTVYNKEARIDAVIVSAAILNLYALNNASYSQIINDININYLGNVIVAKESFKYLEKSKGNLVFFTSSSYTRGRENYSIYSSSKAAVVNLTQALASEWSNFNIKVNCVNPERTSTPMRIKNFGLEDKSTLLTSNTVAEKTLKIICSSTAISGLIIDVRL